jgi:DNA invertase Pin-like site-specific DNA recombinase
VESRRESLIWLRSDRHRSVKPDEASNRVRIYLLFNVAANRAQSYPYRSPCQASAGQNLDRQIGALRAERCDVIFREKVSAKDIRNRPQLEKAIDELGTGDVLVVAEWDRATRSMMDGVHIIERINKRGALIKVLDKPHLDLTTPIGRGFIAFLSALAEDERQRIVGRANAGRALAKARGVKLGRKPKLTDRQQTEARKRLEVGEAARAIARSFNVHHATVLKLLDA